MEKTGVINYMKRHPFLLDAASVIYNMFHSRSYLRYGIFGSLSCRGAFLNHVKIRIRGNNCKVFIGRRTRLNNCVITLRGDSCSLYITGTATVINNALLDMFRSGSAISIGSSFSMEGGRIESMDGKSVIIGDDCMFSREISICNGDNHPIYAVDGHGERLNPSSDVRIGNHVWLGAGVRVLKGVKVEDNVIVGSDGLVSKHLMTPSAVYSGIPAVLKREKVSWRRG